jgi:hypothetical protein
MSVVADTSPLNLVQIQCEHILPRFRCGIHTHGFTGFTCSSTGVYPRIRMFDPNRL